VYAGPDFLDRMRNEPPGGIAVFSGRNRGKVARIIAALETGLHVKGLAGAPAPVIEAARNTAMNPGVLDAFALAIVALDGPPVFPGFPPPNLAAAGPARSRASAAMTALRIAAPDAGAYVNECDYFQANWPKALWGANYPRLSRIKRRYDPDGLFTVHFGLGSERWSPDGFTKLP
jgi:FAD/FMN-containing dehydrogenase